MKRSIEDTPIVFIGAGNLATNLAKALYRKGFRIVQVYSRTIESARTLAEKVEADIQQRFTRSLQRCQIVYRIFEGCRFSRFVAADNRRETEFFVGTYGGKYSDEYLGRACRTIWSILPDADIQQTT